MLGTPDLLAPPPPTIAISGPNDAEKYGNVELTAFPSYI